MNFLALSSEMETLLLKLVVWHAFDVIDVFWHNLLEPMLLKLSNELVVPCLCLDGEGNIF